VFLFEHVDAYEQNYQLSDQKYHS